MHSSISLNLLLITSCAFLKISVIVFFSSVSFFCIFSNSLLNFLLCSSLFSQVWWASLWSLPWTLLERLLIATLLNSCSEVLPYFFICNIFFCLLILLNSVYFYVFSWLATFPSVEEVSLCRRHQHGAPFLLVIRTMCPGSILDVGYMCPYCGGANYCWHANSCGLALGPGCC